MFTLVILIQHMLEFLPRAISQNVKGGIQIGTEVKLLLFEDYMILCIENPKDSIESLLEKK